MTGHHRGGLERVKQPPHHDSPDSESEPWYDADMNTLTPSRETIQALGRYHVAAVFLFGSQVHGRVGMLSDTDVAVLFDEPIDTARSSDLVAALEPLVEPLVYTNQPLELTLLNTAPVSLQLDILKHGQPIVVLNRLIVAQFRESVMQRAGDLLPFLRQYRADRLRGLYA